MALQRGHQPRGVVAAVRVSLALWDPEAWRPAALGAPHVWAQQPRRWDHFHGPRSSFGSMGNSMNGGGRSGFASRM